MYHRSHSLLSPENSLLAVIDLQERLLPVIANEKEIAFNAQRLLEAATAMEVSVVVTEQYPKGLGPTIHEIAAKIPPGTSVVAKKTFSICAVEEVYNTIAESPTSKVILTGAETHVCVLQSAFDLLTMGKEVVLAVDAVGSRFAKDYEIALRRMESYGVVLATTESILFEWCGGAEHPQFKTISRLAKETPTSAPCG